MVWGEHTHTHTHPAETVVTFAVPSWDFRALVTDGGCLRDYLNIMISATYMHIHPGHFTFPGLRDIRLCSDSLCNKQTWHSLNNSLICNIKSTPERPSHTHTHILKCKEVIILKYTLSSFLSHKCTSGFWVYSHLLGMDLFQWPAQTHSSVRSTIRSRHRWTKTEAGRWETPIIRYKKHKDVRTRHQNISVPKTQVSSLALHKSSKIAQQIQQRIFKIICIVLFTIQLLQSNFTGRIYLNAEDFSSIEQILNSFNIVIKLINRNHINQFIRFL